MTQPTERPPADSVGAPRPAAPPPPPNPRIQAMDFAIQFATARKTTAATSSTDIGELVGYAEQIFAFISKK